MFALLYAALSVAGENSVPDDGARFFAGDTLSGALERLRADGLAVVYSSDLVTGQMLVLDTPDASNPEDVARELLAPHGLSLRLVDDIYLVVRGERAPSPGETGSILVLIKDADSGAPLEDASLHLRNVPAASERLSSGAFQLTELAPGNYALQARAPGHEPQYLTGIKVEAGRVSVEVLRLATRETAFETLSVTASRYDLSADIQSSHAWFSRDDVANLPDLGEDPLRTVQQLPGTASGRYTARSHIRGGEDNETLIVLDGLALIDPFHIRDYQDVFSIVDQRAISDIQVYTGGFPVKYGNRMSGVMSIETLDPGPGAHHEIGVSVFNTSLLTSGVFAESRGEWLASARQGNLDRVIDNQFGEPSYNDVLLHGGFDVTDGFQLSANALISNDEVTVITENDDDEREASASATRNGHFWLRLENEWPGGLGSDTVLSFIRFNNDRDGVVDDPESIVGNVRDTRNLQRSGISQEWQLRFGDTNLLQWGAEYARIEAFYDYASEVRFNGFFATFEGVPESRMHSAMVEPDGDVIGVYLTDRLRANDRLTLELGARWDKQTYTGVSNSTQVSPRLSALFRLSEVTDIRASWGRFYQPQAALEMQIEDGVDRFFAAQRADHSILSVQRRFPSGLNLRAEAFWKSFERSRPRFENLFDPLALLPELEPDRVRVAPEDAESRGLEVLLTRNAEDGLSWWASYSLSRVTDNVGGREVPRNWDQRHSLQGGVSWTGEKWDIGFSALIRSGWPTTELTIEALPGGNNEPEVITRIGPRNGERLAGFRNFDFRANRRFELPRGQLNTFIEITNLFNHRNPCCVEYDLSMEEDGTIALERLEEDWLPLVPSIGFLYEF